MESADLLVEKLSHHHGPAPGEGRNGCRPWRGIVEETPCLWVTWLVQACKAAGRPMPAGLRVDGQLVRIAKAELQFGPRYYFKCPQCKRRTEALYYLGREVGCRKCLRLGYSSQRFRPDSVWRLLDLAFDRRPLGRKLRPRYENGDELAIAIMCEVVEPARRLLLKGIEIMLKRTGVYDDETI